MDRSQISHPYPPSYRFEASPEPGLQGGLPSYPPSGRQPSYLQHQQYQQQGYRSYPQSQPSQYNSHNEQDTYLSRSRSSSDPTAPLTPHVLKKSRTRNGAESKPELDHAEGAQPQPHHHHHHLHLPGQGPDVRRDENGLELPDGWDEKDEEAEREFLKQGMFDWKALMGWRYWLRKEWWGWYLAAVILGVLVALMTIFHDQIVDWMTPIANYLKDLPAGWTIPIAILFVLSFPPLFGQEIVAVLVGVVWGLWVGFGIVAAGTFLGEFGNFYAFKYCLRGTAEKYEKKNLNYALMAHIVREGGFWIVFVSRLSAIPGHFTTAVFATCGTGIWVFSIATILTMPKQLVVVYLGVIFKQAGEGHKDKRSTIISAVVLVVGFAVTIYAGWYIYKQMHKARVVVWRKRRAEAKSKGLSGDPVMAEIGGHKEYQEQILDEARSPILRNPGSYQNPYDIGYQSRDNMSFYTVDGPIMKPSHGDLGYGSRLGAEPELQSTEMFSMPLAKPSGQSVNLNRQPTSASLYSANTPTPQGDVSFPVPNAAPPMPTSASSYASAQSTQGQGGVNSPLPSASGVGYAK